MTAAPVLNVRGSKVQAGKPRRAWFLTDLSVPGFASHAMALASSANVRVELRLVGLGR